MNPHADLARERFWAMVSEPDANGCREWRGARITSGYGAFAVTHHHLISAHRFAWEIHRGPIPEGMFVLHHCDNRPCVEITHLFLGTKGDNARDMIAKGRQNDVRGEKNGQARLTAEDVQELRRLHAEGIQQVVLAQRYGITSGHVCDIVKGKKWSWL